MEKEQMKRLCVRKKTLQKQKIIIKNTKWRFSSLTFLVLVIFILGQYSCINDLFVSSAEKKILSLMNEYGYEAKEILADILNNSESVEEKRWAVVGLTEIGEKESLLQSLDNAIPSIKVGILDNLPRFEDKSLVPHIMERLSDPDDEVKLAAAEALGKMGNQEGYDMAVGFLNDNRISIRESAVDALVGIGNSKALPEIKALLESDEYDVVDKAI
ncbi:MAG: HEAT repeat domain-containing protein [Candidatus Aminicenantes bacterium]|nr:HEAT repeat domain-containing protein [Candidatus Aminicenantes bacterium]